MTPTNAGRLAFRREGTSWNAYWAPNLRDMDGSVLMGSIRMNLVEGNPAVKDAFMNTMKLAYEHTAKDVGVRVSHWNNPTVAPEAERSGSA